ncbi:MAG: hypothetical protein LBL34_05015 [Clostridiales bacterium]|jgi:hypothetical protein|nr:hypothetical protein [Clostridiales bacterium]
MITVKLDGRQYNVPIIDYAITPQILDGSGTGRMQSVGWAMFRDPQGTIINVDVTFGVRKFANSESVDFVGLFNKVMSLGITDFISVQFTLPTGDGLTQDMYAVPGNIKPYNQNRGDKIYTDSWQVKFIAKEAYNV